MKEIIHFELQRLVKEKISYILYFILFFSTLLSIYTGCKWSYFQTETINKIQKDQQKKLDEQIKDAVIYEKNHKILDANYPLSFRSYLNYSMNYFVTLPDPNSIFCVGQSDLYSNYIRYKRMGAYTMLVNHELQNPVNLLTGKFDFYFLIVYLIPLFVIVLTFDLISIENELGTLKIVKAYYPNLLKFFAYKLLFRYSSFIVILFSSILLGILLFTPFEYSSYLTLDAIIWFLTIAVYTLFWFVLSFFINSFFKSSTFNGILLIISWLFLVYLIPTFFSSYVNRVDTLPPRTKNVMDFVNIVLENNNHKKSNKIYTDFANSNSKYIKINTDTIVNNLKVNNWRQKMGANFMYLDSTYYQKENEVHTAIHRKYNQLKSLRWFSPILTFQNSMNSFSKNDYENFKLFNDNFQQKYLNLKKHSIGKLFKIERITTDNFRTEGNFHINKREGNIIHGLTMNLIILALFSIFLIVASTIIFCKNI